MSLFLRALLIVFFNVDTPRYIIFKALSIAGLWLMFRKSGIRPWLSIFPWVRDYQLSRCANREPEGRVYSVISVVITVINLVLLIATAAGTQSFLNYVTPLMLVLVIALTTIHLVYNIRIFSGLLEVYGLRKLWILLCIFDETAWIPVLVWGLFKRFQPEWKIEDLREEMERLATEGSATVMDEGLTVNLKDRSVREFFHKKMLLRDIHMAIPQGHLVLLLGGSGAGKTTYLNAVNGYEKANAEVMLNGTNMYTNYKKMQYEVGFVPQTEMMRGKDTVISTLLDSSLLRLSIDIPASERKKRVEEVMEIFGLTAVKNNKVEKLSGGQKKRLSIAMEFLSNPSLFILDEPDSGLDAVMARELFVQLRKIADSGKIVIVITHTPDRVVDLFDDVIVLAKDSTRTGRLAYYGSIGEARKFFGCEKMEDIVKAINQKEEGGKGLADEYVLKYAEVANG